MSCRLASKGSLSSDNPGFISHHDRETLLDGELVERVYKLGSPDDVSVDALLKLGVQSVLSMCCSGAGTFRSITRTRRGGPRRGPWAGQPWRGRRRRRTRRRRRKGVKRKGGAGEGGEECQGGPGSWLQPLLPDATSRALDAFRVSVLFWRIVTCIGFWHTRTKLARRARASLMPGEGKSDNCMETCEGILSRFLACAPC